jgi:hypothetical protein
MDNLILTRQLFDPTSVHTIDLQLVLGSIKKLKNRLLRVDDVWEALMTQFQCFHQLIQNWAKSSTTAVMPRLTGLDGMEAATLQWQRAEFTAAGYRTVDPAWSPSQGMDGTKASAATALRDGFRKHKGLHDFPVHLDYKLLCNRWASGMTCPFGAECTKCCYMSKEHDMYKQP